MNIEDMMPFAATQERMWTLSADRKSVRLAVPPLRLAGIPEPIHAFMDFDAKTVDAMVERLSILRGACLRLNGQIMAHAAMAASAARAMPVSLVKNFALGRPTSSPM
jgi:hypothetical protein